jgi:hypothetical protein
LRSGTTIGNVDCKIIIVTLPPGNKLRVADILVWTISTFLNLNNQIQFSRLLLRCSVSFCASLSNFGYLP